MVYSFFVGLTIGLPVGCYLREVGYANKIKDAYHVLVPAPEADKSLQYKNKSEDFYKNLKRGNAEAKDFERYIYGGTHNLRSKDQADIAEKDIEHIMKEYKSVGKS